MATAPATSLTRQTLYKVKPRSVARGAFTSWLLIKKYVAPEKVIIGEDGKPQVIIPEGMGRSQRGVVHAVPPAITDIKVGDMVVYTNYPMEIEDIEDLTGESGLQLIMDEEVYAVCEPIEC